MRDDQQCPPFEMGDVISDMWMQAQRGGAVIGEEDGKPIYYNDLGQYCTVAHSWRVVERAVDNPYLRENLESIQSFLLAHR